ncbi:MAG: OmpA family protein [Bacteroidota bacterium]
MSRLLLIFSLALFVSVSSKGQTVQWASKVLEFSTELTPIQYSAQQILGKPNVLPAGGENPNAWTPDRANKKEFIKVGFDNPIQIQQIAIAESYSPSAIYRVLAYDEAGTEYEINTFNPRSIPILSRMLNVFVEETPYKVAAVKIEFDGAAVPDYFGIDAIAISDSNIPIIASIELPEGLSEQIVVERLDENINSEYVEYKPLLSPDGKTLYFSRKNHPENIGGEKDPEDIWFAELDENGKWKKAENAGPVLNSDGPNFISSITPDGNTVVLLLGNVYLDNGSMAAGLSTSSRENGQWTKPQAVSIINDYNFSEKANFFLANNRKTLLLSVEREDTQGDRDLYVSFFQDDSTWTEPKNLGPSLNTAAEESAPFLAADDKTLYFASNGYSGYGGNDIYVSKRLDDTWTNWSPPENLGPDINSNLEESFFNIPVSSDYAYYSKGIDEDNLDIVRVQLPIIVTPDPVIVVKGKLVNSETGEPIEAKIIYERLSDGKELGITKSNPETGEYQVVLPAGEKYGFRAEAEGFIAESQNIDLTDFEGDNFTMENQDLKLVPRKEKVIIVLNNVFFDFDKATLKSESTPELDRILGILNEQATMEIEIQGHTDATGPESYNLTLSRRRAEAVKNYFVSKGVSESRLSVAYFGENQPAETNDTREGRSKNRRVQFKIMKE